MPLETVFFLTICKRSPLLRLPTQEVCCVHYHTRSRRRMHTGSRFSLEAGGAMAAQSEVWNLHLVLRFRISVLVLGLDLRLNWEAC
jgi:hypothetical protein